MQAEGRAHSPFTYVTNSPHTEPDTLLTEVKQQEKKKKDFSAPPNAPMSRQAAESSPVRAPNSLSSQSLFLRGGSTMEVGGWRRRGGGTVVLDLCASACS